MEGPERTSGYAQSLGNGQDPLAHEEPREDIIRQVGRHLRHAPGGARRAHASTLAGEGEEALMAAIPAPDPGKAVGEDPTLEVGSEIPFHPGGNRVPERVLVGGCGEEGLEVMLDDGVERRGRGAARAVHGGTGRAGGGARAPCMIAVLAGPGRSGARRGRHASDGSEWSGAMPWRTGTEGVSGSNSAAPRANRTAAGRQRHHVTGESVDLPGGVSVHL
jgi:hypothetical protein